MLKKLLQYKEWVLIIILVAGWASTILYDRKIKQDILQTLNKIEQKLEQNDKNWDEQFEFNGSVGMYIDLDTK